MIRPSLSIVAAVALAACEPSTAPYVPSIQRSMVVSGSLTTLQLDTPLLEAAVLVDGVPIGGSVKYASGAKRADFFLISVPVASGTHTVALQVIQQRDSSVTYAAEGVVVVTDSYGNRTIGSFPAEYRALKAGESISLTLNVP